MKNWSFSTKCKIIWKSGLYLAGKGHILLLGLVRRERPLLSAIRTYTQQEGQIHRFPILLIPLKSGNLLLPNVEVKQYIPSQQHQQQIAGIISSETDYRSNGESVLVLPDVRSTTVRIDSVFGGEEGFRSSASVRG